jgi:hypothetical protein
MVYQYRMLQKVREGYIHHGTTLQEEIAVRHRAIAVLVQELILVKAEEVQRLGSVSDQRITGVCCCVPERQPFPNNFCPVATCCDYDE